MFIVHFKLHKRAVLAAALLIITTLTLAFVLPGCQSVRDQPVAAETEEQRLAYLANLGWQVEPQPLVE